MRGGLEEESGQRTGSGLILWLVAGFGAATARQAREKFSFLLELKSHTKMNLQSVESRVADCEKEIVRDGPTPDSTGLLNRNPKKSIFAHTISLVCSDLS
jgi:hypothetical protein